MKTKKNEILTTAICSFVLASIITILKLCIKDFYLKTYTLPFTLLLIGFLFLTFYLKQEKNKKALFFLIPIVLILGSSFIPIASSNKVINVFILPFLISLFFLSYLNKKYELNRNFWKSIFKLFPSGLLENLKEISIFKKKERKINTSKIANICIGCIFGIPIAFVILSLLTSADQYFNSFIDTLLSFLHNSEKWDTILSNVLKILFHFIVIFNIYRNASKNRKQKQEKEIKAKEINETIIKTILFLINAVFVLFLISEISKLTVNFLELPTEYTYASYAREGFFQLLFVTIINFSIIVYVLYYTNTLDNSKNIKRYILALIVFSIILIFNSYYRMFLYMYEYGFTILRLQVILFLLMELILFCICIKKICFHLKMKDSLLFMCAILTTYIVNLYVCIEPFVNFLNKLFLK